MKLRELERFSLGRQDLPQELEADVFSQHDSNSIMQYAILKKSYSQKMETVLHRTKYWDEHLALSQSSFVKLKLKNEFDDYMNDPMF